MRHFGIALRVCIFFTVISPCLTAETQAQPQRRGLPGPAEVVWPSANVEVPMHRYEALPVIEVTINGAGPYRLVVDTGASGVMLDSDVAAALKLPSPPGMPAGGVKTQVRTPAGPISATLGYIDELQVDDLRIRGIWTIASHLPFGEALDGVIGMSVFRSGLLTYDYPNSRFVLGDGVLPDVNERDVFSYRTPQDSGSHPMIEMTVDGEPFEFLIDSGFRGWFIVPETWAKTQGFTAGPVAAGEALSAGGAMTQRVARMAGPISLGRYSVDQPVVRMLSGVDGSPMLDRRVVGSLFLEQFTVTIDGTNNRIQLANGPGGPVTPPAVRQVGFGLKQNGDHMEIWTVHPESHARTLGLVEGDRIHALNGRPAVDMYRSPAWRELIRTADTVTVTYASAGSGPPRDVELRILEVLPAVR